MKAQFVIILIFCICILSACKKVLKDPLDYYPKVETVSLVVLPDGSVEAKGLIISNKGSDKIEYAGFCMDTLGNPKMSDNQLLTNFVLSGNFTVVYPARILNAKKKFYFRSWAVNGIGYSYGNIVFLENIKAKPVIAPCSLAMNTIKMGSSFQTKSYYVINKPDISRDSWIIRAETSDMIINYDFGSEITTKIFKTSHNSPANGQVLISISFGYDKYYLKPDVPVYVNEILPGKWEITICDGAWDFVGNTYYMNTKFTVSK